MDPITLAIISGLLSGMSGGIVQAGLMEAYDKLKQKIKKYHSNSKIEDAIKNLEENPDSNDFQNHLYNEINKTSINNDPDLVELANTIIELLNKTNNGQDIISKVNNNPLLINCTIGICGNNATVHGGINL